MRDFCGHFILVSVESHKGDISLHLPFNETYQTLFVNIVWIKYRGTVFSSWWPITTEVISCVLYKYYIGNSINSWAKWRTKIVAVHLLCVFSLGVIRNSNNSRLFFWLQNYKFQWKHVHSYSISMDAKVGGLQH